MKLIRKLGLGMILLAFSYYMGWLLASGIASYHKQDAREVERRSLQ